jgi:pimeloyl-ACP methyl ester carboxylesterase
MPPAIERSFVSTPSGRVHVAAAGTGRPVLLLHQTPRSWDEYREVLPLLGRHYRALAMDTPGFGDSDALSPDAVSIENLATAAHQVLGALGHRSAIVVGHHTGACIALEIAAAHPESVDALVLSACPFVDEARRAAAHGKHIIDDVTARMDGSHLGELWAMRRPFYPADRPDLLERFVVDALKAGPMAAGGHRMVDRYEMDKRVPLVRCPTLVIAPTADPHAYPNAPKVAAAIAGSKLIEIEKAMVPLPDQMPVEFAEAVHAFIASLAGGGTGRK